MSLDELFHRELNQLGKTLKYADSSLIDLELDEGEQVDDEDEVDLDEKDADSDIEMIESIAADILSQPRSRQRDSSSSIPHQTFKLSALSAVSSGTVKPIARSMLSPPSKKGRGRRGRERRNKMEFGDGNSTMSMPLSLLPSPKTGSLTLSDGRECIAKSTSDPSCSALESISSMPSSFRFPFIIDDSLMVEKAVDAISLLRPPQCFVKQPLSSSMRAVVLKTLFGISDSNLTVGELRRRISVSKVSTSMSRFRSEFAKLVSAETSDRDCCRSSSEDLRLLPSLSEVVSHYLNLIMDGVLLSDEQQLECDFNFGLPLDLKKDESFVNEMTAMGFAQSKVVEALVICEHKCNPSALMDFLLKDPSEQKRIREESKKRIGRGVEPIRHYRCVDHIRRRMDCVRKHEESLKERAVLQRADQILHCKNPYEWSAEELKFLPLSMIEDKLTDLRNRLFSEQSKNGGLRRRLEVLRKSQQRPGLLSSVMERGTHSSLRYDSGQSRIDCNKQSSGVCRQNAVEMYTEFLRGLLSGVLDESVLLRDLRIDCSARSSTRMVCSDSSNDSVEYMDDGSVEERDEDRDSSLMDCDEKEIMPADPASGSLSVYKSSRISVEKEAAGISDTEFDGILSRFGQSRSSLESMRSTQSGVASVDRSGSGARSNRLCVFCYDKERDVMLIPCNHIVVCHVCLDEHCASQKEIQASDGQLDSHLLESRPRLSLRGRRTRTQVRIECPVCRTSVSDYRRVYYQ